MTDLEHLNSLLQRRHSCRAFLPKAVAKETIEAILETAQRVPSWCNAQPWQVHVTMSDETDRLREELYKAATENAHKSDIAFPAKYTGAYQARRRTCGWALYEAVGVKAGDRQSSAAQMMKNFRLFDAPHLALITTERDLGPYGLLDCGAFITAFTLAAEALGVASIPQAALAGQSEFLRKWFDISVERDIVAGISFGYSDKDHKANGFRTERAALEEVVTWYGHDE